MGSKKERRRSEKVRILKEELVKLASEARDAIQEDSQTIVWLINHPLKIMLHKYLFRKLKIKKCALDLDKIRKQHTL